MSEARMARRRSNSVKQALAAVPDHTHLLSAPNTPPTPTFEPSESPESLIKLKTEKEFGPKTITSFWSDLITFQWMTKPASSFKMILFIMISYILWEFSPTTQSNPFQHLLFISYKLDPIASDLEPKFDKGILDAAFLGFYVIVFSWIRQVVTEFGVRPLAVRSGIRGESKLARFMEQGYAFCYFFCSSALGLYVMTGQKSWWYRVEYYWVDYPHIRMEGPLKAYYLLQFAYWCQQMLVLVLRIEKPRSDIYELILHHLVTLWLVGWSYALNFTIVGTAVFVSMDVPDVCLALSKCLNYLELQRISEASFVFFLFVWHYMRHYLNIKILFSVYYDLHDYIPESMRAWSSPYQDHPDLWWLPFGVRSGVLPTWIRDQIFLPILLLQFVNLFWSALIWRVLFRMIFGTGLVDVREEGEEDKKDI